MIVKEIRLEIQNMSATQLASYLDPSVLAEIKKSDEKPLFKAFSVAHEGESHGTVIGLGLVALKWLKGAILALHNKLQMGTKLLHDHSPISNSHEGRTVVGEVVGKVKEVINGILHSIVIGYIKPEYRHIDFDAASFEGEVVLPEDLKNPIVEESAIQAITGIALFKSDPDNLPAFSGATLQAQLQMMSAKGEGENMLTFDEILDFIKKDSSITPSSIFSIEELAKDGGVEQIIKDGNKNTYHLSTRLKREKEELKDKYEADLSKLKAKIKEQSEIIMATTSSAKIPEIIKERKLSDKLAIFVNTSFSAKKFKPLVSDDAPDLTVQLNSFVDEQVNEYKKLQEAGIIPKDEEEGKESGGSGADDKDKSNTPSDVEKRLMG